MDSVNHPEHYTRGKIECIEAIKESMTIESFKGYLKGNIIKYLWRYENKGKPIEDLQKAKWYLDKLISEVEYDTNKEVNRSTEHPSAREKTILDLVTRRL